MIKSVTTRLVHLKKSADVDYLNGEALYNEGCCQILSQSAGLFDLLINVNEEDVEVRIEESAGELKYYLDGKNRPWDAYGIAALMPH